MGLLVTRTGAERLDMKFKKGHVYTHQNILDVVIFVQDVLDINEEFVELKIRWFNRRGMDLHAEEVIKVNGKEYPRWYEWEGEVV